MAYLDCADAILDRDHDICVLLLAGHDAFCM